MFMRRTTLAIGLGIALVMGATAAIRPPVQLVPPDAVARLLSGLEAALASGDATRLTALESSALAPDIVNGIARSVVTGPGATVVVRERTRRRTPEGAEVLADVFLGHGERARVVTWRIHAQSTPDGRALIAGLDEQGALTNLMKLTLDATHQFAVHNLNFHAIDLALTMSSGSAFLAQADDGVTAVVLHGRGSVRFDPPDRGEQGQLQAFAHQSELAVKVTDVFIRLNPEEFNARVAEGALTPVSVNAEALAGARQIFDEFSPLTYGIDLRDLGQTGWSFEPGAGNVIVEFKAGRLGWLTYARSPNELEDVTLFKRTGSKLISSYASEERLATRGRFYDEAANATYRVEHYDLDVTFDPLRRLLRGQASMRLRIMADVANSITVRLNDDLIVSSVTAPGADRLLTVRLTGQHRLLISLPATVPRGADVRIDISYAGRLSPPALDREALDPGAEDPNHEAGEDQQPGDFRPDPEPVWIYSGRAAWYPQAESLDHATAMMRFHVPAEYDVVASGRLVRSSVDAPSASGTGERTSEFVADRPIRYIACAISHFAAVTSVPATVPALSQGPDESGAHAGPSGPASINVSVVATPRSTNQARALAARTSDILHFYATLVGEAPYSSFTLATVDDNIPGGQSPAYMTVLRERLPTSQFLWRSDPVAFDQVPYFLLAHEVAHQWWGQAVGWKSYHEQWLSEGLAQYFAVLYAGSNQGPSTMHDLLSGMRSSVFGMPGAGPISLGYRLGHLSNEPSMFRVILYNKSAVVLDMLRRLIGDKAFYAGLSRFYREHRFATAGADDLARAFQPETTIPMDHFLDTWILNSGIPEARVLTQVDAGGRTATIRVDSIGPPADFPLTLAIQYEDGTTEDVTIPVTGDETTRQIALKGPVRHLVTKDEVTLVRFRN
jgi:Peptidase family M1 domain